MAFTNASFWSWVSSTIIGRKAHETLGRRRAVLYDNRVLDILPGVVAKRF